MGFLFIVLSENHLRRMQEYGACLIEIEKHVSQLDLGNLLSGPRPWLCQLQDQVNDVATEVLEESTYWLQSQLRDLRHPAYFHEPFPCLYIHHLLYHRLSFLFEEETYIFQTLDWLRVNQAVLSYFFRERQLNVTVVLLDQSWRID